jgi:hypothetical protein
VCDGERLRSNWHAVIGDGTAANRSTAVSISASGRPRVKLDSEELSARSG